MVRKLSFKNKSRKYGTRSISQFHITRYLYLCQDVFSINRYVLYHGGNELSALFSLARQNKRYPTARFTKSDDRVFSLHDSFIPEPGQYLQHKDANLLRHIIQTGTDSAETIRCQSQFHPARSPPGKQVLWSYKEMRSDCL